MSALELLSESRCFGGRQRSYRHASSSTGTPMKLSVYLPPQAEDGPCPTLWFLSGLTCTDENVTTKSGIQRRASARGLVVVAPDTSPRGAGIPGEDDAWDFGTGAGFYVDATTERFRDHYRMFRYVTDELPALLQAELPIREDAQGVTGHSMGGHGALVVALRRPDRFRTVSAFAPITNPTDVPWGKKAFSGYLGDDEARWDEYDAVKLLRAGRRVDHILVDQGTADAFLDVQLKPERLRQACDDVGQPLTLRMQQGYDHGYFFVSTFVDDHVDWHADRLARVDAPCQQGGERR